jgi:hypothetical protein
MSEKTPGKTADKPVLRTAAGHFLPGTAQPSGGGRPTLPPWLKGHTEDLLRVQLAVALQGTRPNPEGGDPIPVGEKVWAATVNSLLDRVLGRAPVSVEVEGGDGVNAVLAALLARKAGPVDPG